MASYYDSGYGGDTGAGGYGGGGGYDPQEEERKRQREQQAAMARQQSPYQQNSPDLAERQQQGTQQPTAGQGQQQANALQQHPQQTFAQLQQQGQARPAPPSANEQAYQSFNPSWASQSMDPRLQTDQQQRGMLGPQQVPGQQAGLEAALRGLPNGGQSGSQNFTPFGGGYQQNQTDAFRQAMGGASYQSPDLAARQMQAGRQGMADDFRQGMGLSYAESPDFAARTQAGSAPVTDAQRQQLEGALQGLSFGGGSQNMAMQPQPSQGAFFGGPMAYAQNGVSAAGVDPVASMGANTGNYQPVSDGEFFGGPMAYAQGGGGWASSGLGGGYNPNMPGVGQQAGTGPQATGGKNNIGVPSYDSMPLGGFNGDLGSYWQNQLNGITTGRAPDAYEASPDMMEQVRRLTNMKLPGGDVSYDPTADNALTDRVNKLKGLDVKVPSYTPDQNFNTTLENLYKDTRYTPGQYPSFDVSEFTKGGQQLSTQWPDASGAAPQAGGTTRGGGPRGGGPRGGAMQVGLMQGPSQGVSAQGVDPVAAMQGGAMARGATANATSDQPADPFANNEVWQGLKSKRWNLEQQPNGRVMATATGPNGELKRMEFNADGTRVAPRGMVWTPSDSLVPDGTVFYGNDNQPMVPDPSGQKLVPLNDQTRQQLKARGVAPIGEVSWVGDSQRPLASGGSSSASDAASGSSGASGGSGFDGSTAGASGGSTGAFDVNSQMQQSLSEALKNPSGFDNAAVQQLYDRMGQNIDDQYAQQQTALREEMAGRGLSDSSIMGGRLADLNVGQRQARTELANQLGIQRAQDYATQRNALLGLGLQNRGQDLSSQQASAQLAQQAQDNAASRALQQQLGMADVGIRQQQLSQQAQQMKMDNALAQQRLGLDRTLGMGNLDLNKTRATQDYSLGLGNLDLGKTRAAQDYSLGAGNLNLQSDLGRGRLGLDAQTAAANVGLNRDRLALDASGQQFDQGMRGLDFQNKVGQQNFTNQMSTAELQARLQDQGFRQGMSQAEFAANQNQRGFQNQISAADLGLRRSGQEFNQGMTGLQFQNQLGQQGFQNRMSTAEFNRLLGNDAYSQRMGITDRLNSYGQQAFDNDLRTADFNRQMQNDQWRRYLDSITLGG